MAVVFVLLIRTNLPPVAIFTGALALAIVLRLTSIEHGLKGFSNPGVLTIGALLMVSAGVNATGAINIFTERFFRRTHTVSGVYRHILPQVAVGAAFLDNATIVPMMIPNLRDIGWRKQLPASKLFLPLSYAAILGGTVTLIGTPANLVIAGLVGEKLAAGEVSAAMLRELSLFDPARIALPVAIAGIGFIMLFGNRLLPDRVAKESPDNASRRYRAEFRIPQSSPLIGQSIENAGLTQFDGGELIMVSSAGDSLEPSSRKAGLREDDILAFQATAAGLAHLWENYNLVPLHTIKPMETQRHNFQLVEVVAAPTALAIGRRLSELPQIEHPYKMAVVGISRHSEPLSDDISQARIETGDNVVLEVDDSFFFHNRNETEFALIRKLPGFRLKRTDRALVATALTFAMIVTVTAGWLSLLTAALLTAGLMIATGCLDLQTAGGSVNFANLIVLACAIGLEAVVVDTGLSEHITSAVINIGIRNPYIAIATIYCATALLANLISGASAVALIFPIALSLANTLNLEFTPFAITMMTGACPFISPAGTPTNLAVYGPGGYRFHDYVKLGLPLTILSGLLTVFLVPIVFSIGPA